MFHNTVFCFLAVLEFHKIYPWEVLEREMEELDSFRTYLDFEIWQANFIMWGKYLEWLNCWKFTQDFVNFIFSKVFHPYSFIKL